MKHLVPRRPLGRDALAALTRIECATTLRDLDDAVETLRAETLRRERPSMLIALLAALLAGVGLALARTDVDAGALHFILPVVAALFADYLVRGPRRWDEDQRLRRALNVNNVLKRANRARP